MPRPNILLITTDQQRVDTIAALGNRFIHTPHLNWLCDEGVTFTKCYADCPICMPSRATIMTGLAGYTMGLTGNNSSITPLAEHPTLPALLSQSGYQTHAQGKMHFHPIRAHYGFEEMELPLDYFREKRKYGRVASKQSGVGENEIEPVISAADEVDSLTWWTIDRSIDFLESRDETRPFFLWTSFTKPHPPFECGRDYWALYQNAMLPEPVRGDWTPPAAVQASTWSLNSAWRMSPQQLLDSRRAYYACITQIDYNLGRLFARMREMELLENTWIIFTSDHGDMLGDHGMGAKSSFLEGSAHVPLIVRPPLRAQRANEFCARRCDQLVTLADIMPTILQIAGVDAPRGDGVDLMQVLAQDVARPFFGVSGTMSAVYDGKFKYLFTNAGGDALLFDMENDPKELHDLSGQPQYAGVKEKLHAMLAAHLREHAPSFLTENGELASKTPRPQNKSRWPGLHSNFFPTDVLH